jgi:hypothetical protein
MALAPSRELDPRTASKPKRCIASTNNSPSRLALTKSVFRLCGTNFFRTNPINRSRLCQSAPM